MLMLGREVRFPAEIIYGSATEQGDSRITNCGDYVNQLCDRMQEAHEIARKHLGASAKRQKLDYDAKLSFHKYEVGDCMCGFDLMLNNCIFPQSCAAHMKD